MGRHQATIEMAPSTMAITGRGDPAAAGAGWDTGVNAGAANLKIWHPYLKAPGNEIVRPVALGPAAASLIVNVDLRAAPDRSGAY